MTPRVTNPTNPTPPLPRGRAVAVAAPPARPSSAFPTFSLARFSTFVRPAFTLIELMVTIAILALLVAIGAVAANLVMENTREQQTRIVRNIAKAAESQYYGATGERLNHGDYTATPIDWDDEDFLQNAELPPSSRTRNQLNDDTDTDATTFITIERFVAACLEIPAAEEQLNLLRADDRLQDTDGDGYLEIVDAWDTPLRFRSSFEGAGSNFENNDFYDLGMPPHRDPYLASAGRDGLFGVIEVDNSEYPDTGWGPDTGDADGPFAEDNLYSFEVQQ